MSTLPTAGGGSAVPSPWRTVGRLVLALTLTLEGLALLYAGLRPRLWLTQPATSHPKAPAPSRGDAWAPLRAYLERFTAELERMGADLEKIRHDGAQDLEDKKERQQEP